MSQDTPVRRSGRTRRSVIEYKNEDLVLSGDELIEDSEVQDSEATIEESEVEVDLQPIEPGPKTKKRAIPKSSKPRKKQKHSIEESNTDILEVAGLFAQLSSNFSAKKIASRFFQLYNGNDRSAIVDFLNSIVQLAGIQSILTETLVFEEDRDDVVQSLASIDNTKSSDKKDVKRIFKKFISFLDALFDLLEGEALYDESFVLQAIEWLSRMSSSSLVSLRSYASEIIYHVSFKLIDINLNLSHESDHLNTQIENGGITGDRLKQLREDSSEIEARIEVLDAYVHSIFEKVFIHRYRDVRSNIRSLSIDSLAKWIKASPGYFLKDQYLKYFGWCLSDKEASVRKAVLDNIISFYNEGHEFIPMLEMFKQRFLARFDEMTRDISSEVAALAVKLLTILLRNHCLDENHGDNIGSLIWDSDHGVREAAAQFAFEDSFFDDGSTPKSPLIDLNEALNLFEDCKPDQESITLACDYFIRYFYPLVPALYDWESIISFMFASEDKKTSILKKLPPLNASRENILVHLLRSSMKYTFERKPTKKDISSHKKILDSLQTIIVPTISRIITHFQNKDGAAAATSLLLFVPLETFSLLQGYNQHFNDILRALKATFLKHRDPLTLEKIAHSFDYLASSDHSYANLALNFIRELADEMFSAIPEADDDSVNVTLARIHSLSSKLDIPVFGLFQTLVPQTDTDNERSILLLRLCENSFLWSVFKLDPDDHEQRENAQKAIDMLNELIELSSISSDFDLNYTLFQVCSTFIISCAQHAFASGIQNSQFLDLFSFVMEKSNDQIRFDCLSLACRVALLSNDDIPSLASYIITYFEPRSSSDISHVIRSFISTFRHKFSDSLLLSTYVDAFILAITDLNFSTKKLHDFSLDLCQIFAMAGKKKVPFDPFFRRCIEFGCTVSNARFLVPAFSSFVKRASLSCIEQATKLFEQKRVDLSADGIDDDTESALVDFAHILHGEKGEGDADIVPSKIKTKKPKKKARPKSTTRKSLPLRSARNASSLKKRHASLRKAAEERIKQAATNSAAFSDISDIEDVEDRDTHNKKDIDLPSDNVSDNVEEILDFTQDDDFISPKVIRRFGRNQ